MFICLQLHQAREDIEKTVTEKNLIIEKLTAKQEMLSELEEECHRLKPFEVRVNNQCFKRKVSNSSYRVMANLCFCNNKKLLQEKSIELEKGLTSLTEKLHDAMSSNDEFENKFKNLSEDFAGKQNEVVQLKVSHRYRHMLKRKEFFINC